MEVSHPPKQAHVPDNVEAIEQEAGGITFHHGEKGATELEEVELMEDTPLRVLGYFGRLGRLAGMALAKGSRYVAYSSDVGESFRPVVDPKYVRAGYGIAIAYVATDVALVAKAAQERKEDVARATSQQLTFQVLGSLLLPSIAIHQGVHLAQKTFFKVGRFQKWGPVVTGLAMIPFMPVLIDEPVEHAVHYAFNELWPVGEKQTSSPEGPATATR
mmetsp:Transcript_7088/g.12453  ORF Transcript_7088/g.12453 Transcript_7088/m.12453 type:complete len:216 (-) Transcript_7088:274-921(-)